MDMNESNDAHRSNKPLPSVAIDVAEFYPRFAKAVKKSCADNNLGAVEEEAILNSLLIHTVQFQSNNNVVHLERHVKMAVNIIRENGIEDTDPIISTWSPLLLIFTAKFITLKLVERTPIWRLVAHVDGTLYITPE